MRFKEGRAKQKSQYGTYNWLKKVRQKTYGLSVEEDIKIMGLLFEDRKEAMGFPKDGQKITYSKPTKVAWFKSVVDAEKLLTLGNQYTVRRTELNSSSSYVWLEEFPEDDRNQPFFSLWAFDWEGKIKQ